MKNDKTTAWKTIHGTRNTGDLDVDKLPCIVHLCGERRSRMGYCAWHWEDKQNGVPILLKDEAKHEQVMNELKLINVNLGKLISSPDPLSDYNVKES